MNAWKDIRYKHFNYGKGYLFWVYSLPMFALTKCGFIHILYEFSILVKIQDNFYCTFIADKNNTFTKMRGFPEKQTPFHLIISEYL